MKRSLLIIVIVFCSARVFGQENMFSLSGGYVFTNIENADQDATGFKINGLYEFNPQSGMVAHGFSIGYVHTSTSNTVANQTTDYKLSNWPVYYAPKFLFLDGSFKLFLKGALGAHFSSYKREGALGELETKDFGFYGGAGAGLSKSFGEKIFVNLEYEWAYLSNLSYSDGFVNTISGGIGMRF